MPKEKNRSENKTAWNNVFVFVEKLASTLLYQYNIVPQILFFLFLNFHFLLLETWQRTGNIGLNS